MDLLHLVDRLEELVGGAQRMPIGSRVMMDRRRLLDTVDQMRVAIPEEIREAQRIVAEHERLRREAEEEARLIIARAEEQAQRLVSDHAITQQAEQDAQEFARDAEARLEERISSANADIRDRIDESRRLAKQQMRAADEYARELLQRLDRQLQAFVSSVESGIAQLAATPRSELVDEAGFHGVLGDAEGLGGAGTGRPDLPAPPAGGIDDFSLPALDDEPGADTLAEGAEDDGPGGRP